MNVLLWILFNIAGVIAILVLGSISLYKINLLSRRFPRLRLQCSGCIREMNSVLGYSSCISS